MSIYHHFKRDHESSGFLKLAVNKWICEKNLRLIFLKKKKKLTEKRDVQGDSFDSKQIQFQFNLSFVSVYITIMIRDVNLFF